MARVAAGGGVGHLDVETFGDHQPGEHRRRERVRIVRSARMTIRVSDGSSSASATSARTADLSSNLQVRLGTAIGTPPRPSVSPKSGAAAAWRRVVGFLFTRTQRSLTTWPRSLIGAQWATRAAVKATDLLGGRLQWVVRYQGGNNAGHTVVLPSGRPSRCI